MGQGMMVIDSKIGNIYVVSSDNKIVSISFSNPLVPLKESTTLHSCVNQIQAFLSGALTNFNLPIKTEGTDFQKKVWEELLKIPFGELTTYSKIANKLCLKNGSRTVGNAISKNPLPILIPCHRVVGKSGNLTGYLGGIDKKRFLLKLEGHANQRQLQFN